MKARFIWITFGLAFFITLAVVVGQRLSSEAMAVVVGVVAGVAASIPTSLIVVWVATRNSPNNQHQRQTTYTQTPPTPTPQPSEPRIVVMPSPYQPPTSYPPLTAPNAYPHPVGAQGYSQFAQPVMSVPVARQFTVIGGDSDSFNEGDDVQLMS